MFKKFGHLFYTIFRNLHYFILFSYSSAEKNIIVYDVYTFMKVCNHKKYNFPNLKNRKKILKLNFNSLKSFNKKMAILIFFKHLKQRFFITKLKIILL